MTRIASTWRPGTWDATPPGAAPPVVVTGPHAPPPKRRGRWRTVLVASLALHALAIAIIVLAVRQEHMTDLDALPALDISLAEGPRAPAASPNPTLQSSPGPPST